MKNKYTAKFIRKVTTVTAPRNNNHNFKIAEDGKYYEFGVRYSWYTSQLKVGDRAYIAKLRNTFHSTDCIWDIYEIELPTTRCWHTKIDSNRPQTWFGNLTYLVIPKQNRVNKKKKNNQ